MQAFGSGFSAIRIHLNGGAPDLATDLFRSGQVLKAEVVSVFEGRTVLAFGRGVLLEAAMQTPLQEGQKLLLQVQPPPVAGQVAQTQQGQPQIILKLLETQGDIQLGQSPTAASGNAAQASQTFWLPIPLPDGGQGWVQIHVDQEAGRHGKGKGGEPISQVRLWWETPDLGQVQVNLDSGQQGLKSIFTAQSESTVMRIQEGLPGLRVSLSQLGYATVQLACRQAMPGETVGPVRPAAAARLDQRV